MKPFLDGRSLEQRIADAIDLLKENGYMVRGPLTKKTNVKTVAHLITFFYDTLLKYRPDRKYGYGSPTKKDRGLVAQFIASRQATGVSRGRAIQECCELIDLLFRYEHILGLSRPITSLSVLGQEKFGWVTERLLGIKAGVDGEATAEEDAKYFDQLYRQQEKKVDLKKLEEAKTRMDEVLKRYAKKSKKD